MIAHLKGQIIIKTDKGVIIDTGPVGYFVHTTSTILSKTEENSEISFFIYSHIREDTFDLYGFMSYEEMTFFTQILTVNGVGPKVAIEILNTPQEKMKAAILNEDEAFICRIKGIGNKTAKKIIIELKDKINKESLDIREYKSITKETHTDAVEALIKLGYQRHEIIKTIASLPENFTQTEEIITYLLKNI